MKPYTSVLSRLVPALLILVVASGCGGGKKIRITQYPQFYKPDDPTTHINSMAVIPFRNHAASARADHAGEAIAEELAGLLTRSGTYKHVYDRSNLSALMSEQDLKIAMGEDANAMAGAFRKLASVQAMLTGSVTGYNAGSRTWREQYSEPRWNPHTKRFDMIQKYRMVTQNEATVTATATLLRVKNASAIHSTGPVTGRSISKGTPPARDKGGCLAEARRQVVYALREHFAIVKKTIKVGKNALQIAGGFHDGQWKKKSKFKASDRKMFVVIKLPDCCEFNRFRVAIVRDGQEANLVLKDFTWKKGYAQSGRGFEFDITSFGPGKYVAKFYAAQGPVKPSLTQKFKIIANN